MCNFGVSEMFAYYTHVPVFILSLLLGVFIFLSNRKSQVNKNLFIFILFFCFWVINDLFQWIITDPKINIFLAKIALLEVASLIFFLYFSYYFVGKEISRLKKVLFALPFLPILLFMFTDYNIYLVGGDQCNTEFGNLYYYAYLFLVVYLALPVKILFSAYRNVNTEKRIKNQIRIAAIAIAIMVSWFLGIMIFTEISVKNGFAFGDSVFLFAPIGMIPFIALLAYAITEYQFLKMKLIASQVLTYVIWILIGSMFFFVEGTLVYLLVGLTLLLSILFGLILIRSIKEEAARKEDLQAMADALSRANDQLRKLDNAKTEFISIASHQLRTPLTAIKGFLSLVLEGSYGEITPQVHGALDKTYAAAERLISLVEDLLNISRMEAGRMEYKFAKEDVQDLLQELYDNFILVAKRKKLSLELLHASKKLPLVTMDRAKVREVLSNIIDNALKYTDKGGVKIKTEILEGNAHGKQDKDVPSTEKGEPLAGKCLRITVADTGIGIPESEMQYLFKKFSRGKDIARLNAGGTGLGIYVGKSMMEAHHGRIWAQSAGAGKGASFVVELPID